MTDTDTETDKHLELKISGGKSLYNSQGYRFKKKILNLSQKDFKMSP